MFLSDEPGFYKEGAFGIRLESDLVVAPVATRYDWGTRPYLSFRYLTPVPMCRALVERALLSPDEAAWLDTFHARCWEEVAPLLAAAADGEEDAARARAWLWAATRPLAEAVAPPCPPP